MERRRALRPRRGWPRRALILPDRGEWRERVGTYYSRGRIKPLLGFLDRPVWKAFDLATGRVVVFGTL